MKENSLNLDIGEIETSRNPWKIALENLWNEKIQGHFMPSRAK